MKKTTIIIVVALIIIIGGYAVYKSSQSTTTSTSENGSVDISSETTSSADCGTNTGHTRIVCLATALKASASADLNAKLQLEYNLTNAKKWSNFPPMGYRNRIGPTLSEFNTEQLALVKEILKEASGTLSNEGKDEIEQILNADDYLNAQTGESGFTSGNYHIAFLGTPSATGTWELQFGGHHLAFANTYTNGVLVGATPSFRGVEPFTTFTQNGRENMPLQQEQAAFAAMLGSLSSTELASAKLNQVFSDIVVGPQKDNTFPTTKSGVKVGSLSAEKQALVVKAIETYVNDIDSTNAATIMQKYKSELADTYISYTGTASVNAVNDYVRIDGPSVWIELSMQRGASLPGAHPHSVWRDKTADYGGTK